MVFAPLFVGLKEFSLATLHDFSCVEILWRPDSCVGLCLGSAFPPVAVVTLDQKFVQKLLSAHAFTNKTDKAHAKVMIRAVQINGLGIVIGA